MYWSGRKPFWKLIVNQLIWNKICENVLLLYKKKQLNCLCCIRDVNENFLKRLLEHPVWSSYFNLKNTVYEAMWIRSSITDLDYNKIQCPYGPYLVVYDNEDSVFVSYAVVYSLCTMILFNHTCILTMKTDAEMSWRWFNTYTEISYCMYLYRIKLPGLFHVYLCGLMKSMNNIIFYRCKWDTDG